MNTTNPSKNMSENTTSNGLLTLSRVWPVIVAIIAIVASFVRLEVKVQECEDKLIELATVQYVDSEIKYLDTKLVSADEKALIHIAQIQKDISQIKKDIEDIMNMLRSRESSK